DSKVLRIDGDGRVFLSVDGQERELGELSSGYAALVKMVQAIIAGYAAFTNEVQLQNVRGIVLIDEIDAHLHPAWQARIVFCLKTLLPNTTFYIATHSPLVLVQLLNGEAYRLKRDDDGVVRNELIRHPGRRLFVDTLDDGFGIDLNKLKRDMMEHDDQTDAKRGLLDLLDQVEAMEKAEQ
ncbi:MAG: AAA family ATPase, partial [Candidatus Accumulibacter sp.]|nr:AAA family ATPase [Accumulibacter sp.]